MAAWKDAVLWRPGRTRSCGGLPMLLVYSTLTFWLLEEGLDIESVGLFAATALPYSLKFLWAPIVDRFPIPGLGRIVGLRRGWLLVIQLALMGAIGVLASTNPGENALMCAVAALTVAFLSASQDVVVDAYRVELLDDVQQGAGAASAVFGYHVGMLVASAGALHIAALSGSWSFTYLVMAALMMVGITTTVLCSEPDRETRPAADDSVMDNLREGVVGPLKDVLGRRGWVVIASKTVIANVAQSRGLGASILGVFVGGVVVRR